MTTPLLLPFPSSHNVLESSAFHGIAQNGQLISRVMPNDCCWFAQAGHPATSRIPDGFLVRRDVFASESRVESSNRRIVRKERTKNDKRASVIFYSPSRHSLGRSD